MILPFFFMVMAIYAGTSLHSLDQKPWDTATHIIQHSVSRFLKEFARPGLKFGIHYGPEVFNWVQITDVAWPWVQKQHSSTTSVVKLHHYHAGCPDILGLKTNL